MADTAATDDHQAVADEESHGPKYHAQQKVLCIDTNNATSDDASAPLYEAVIRKSELKFIDPTTKKILPNRKRGRGRGRGGAAAVTALDQNNHGVGSGLLQEWCYHVHFNGWNSRWDRWVTEQDLFDDTIENRTRVAENSGKAIAKSQSKQKEDTKKRKRGTATTTENGSNLQLITRACELPFTLQTVLCDDRDKITVKVYPPPTLSASGGALRKNKKPLQCYTSFRLQHPS